MLHLTPRLLVVLFLFIARGNPNGQVKTTQPSLTLHELKEKFATEEDCKKYLKELRWPNGVHCPRCNNEKVYELKARPFHWVCNNADCGGKNGYRFSVITRTVFENTSYPLRTRFEVIYLMTQRKKGMAALRIYRQIGSGDYRTAWYMCHRIRTAIKDAGVMGSLLKRGIMGQFHHVSKKYLPLYLSEFSYRHNQRKNPDVFRDVIAGC